MHSLPVPNGHRETFGQADPKILSVLHGRKLETGQGVFEHQMSVLALSHGEKSGHGKSQSSINFSQKASPWGSFRSGIDE